MGARIAPARRPTEQRQQRQPAADEQDAGDLGGLEFLAEGQARRQDGDHRRAEHRQAGLPGRHAVEDVDPQPPAHGGAGHRHEAEDADVGQGPLRRRLGTTRQHQRHGAEHHLPGGQGQQVDRRGRAQALDQDGAGRPAQRRHQAEELAEQAGCMSHGSMIISNPVSVLAAASHCLPRTRSPSSGQASSRSRSAW
jgi:hypothetical protein